MAQQGYFDWGTTYGRDPAWDENGWLNGLFQQIIYGPTGYLENNPQALWTRMITPWASGSDPFSRYVQGEYGNFWKGYDAAWATNPDLLRQQYASRFGEDYFRNQWNKLAPGQRGENPGRYGAGRMQWIV
jgi:hypothetical protein